MSYKDRWATDEQGNQFIFTVEMQRRLAEAGLAVEPASLAQLESEKPAARPAPPARKQYKEKRAATPAGTRPSNIPEPLTIQIDSMTGKYIGRLKWYNAKKGFGFIIRGGGEEIFFHKTGTDMDLSELAEGQWVLYDVEETHKGPEATDIEPYYGDTAGMTGEKE